METWLRELRSSPDERALRAADRQLKAGFRLLRRDRTILALTLLGTLALTAVWVGFFFLEREGGPPSREADQVFRRVLFGAVLVGVSLLASLSIACAVDARIDGTHGGLRQVGAEVAERLPALLGWWAISVAAWIGFGIAVQEVLRPALAFLAGAALWGLGTIFVVPLLAIDGGGPLAAFGNGLVLLRKRWGRALAGLVVLGFLLGLFSLLAGAVLREGDRRYPLDPDAGTWIYIGGIALLYLGSMVMLATREGFALILARDALGDLPGEPAKVKPQRRGWVLAKQIALVLVCLVVIVGVLAAIFGPDKRNAQGSSAAPPAGTRFFVGLTGRRAERIEVGAPVRLGATRIGTVYDTALEAASGNPPVIQVSFELEPAWIEPARRCRLAVAERNGDAYLQFRQPSQRSR